MVSRFTAVVVLGLALVPALYACQPLVDECRLGGTGEPVALDEVGPPGFAAVDVLFEAGAYEVQDGDYDLAVTLDWAEEAVPRKFRWVDGDGDGVVPEESCPLDYVVVGTITIDSGDGRYNEVVQGDVVAAENGGTIWMTLPARDVRGDEVPGKELWIGISPDGDGLRFELTAIGVGGRADYLVDAPLVPAAP
jgi:hypothetical protein